MTLRFKCPNCKKGLAVKDELAGRRGACPACKRAIVIPALTGAAVDVEALAASVLADAPAEKPAETVRPPIKFACPYCDEESEFAFDLAGKQTPCPACKRIVKIPLPKEDKPKDWRELIKKGPAAALINQPEQLEGAWGAEVKTQVSRTALEEAEAIPELAAAPVGVLGWVKRGAIAVVVVGVLAGGYFAVNRHRSSKAQADHLAEALKAADYRNKDVKLPPLLAAEIYRGAGVKYLREGKADEARKHFDIARDYLKTGTKEEIFLVELALGELALDQCELGGNKEQILDKARFDWGEVQEDLKQTLGAIQQPETKVWAVRILVSRLLEKNQAEVAVGLAISSANETKGVLAPQVGLLLASDDARDKATAAKLLEPPDLGKKTISPLARIAYADGHARRGQWAQAKNLVQFQGAAADRLEACLAVGSLAKVKEEIAFFFREGHALLAQAKATPWQQFQLAKLGLAAGAVEETKELAKTLPVSLRARWQLDKIQAELQRTGSSVQPTVVEEVSEVKSSARALAWSLVARHFARHGRSSEVTSAAADLDPAIQAMIHLGLALGEQDR